MVNKIGLKGTGEKRIVSSTASVNLRGMRRVLWVILASPLLCAAQQGSYVDTIKGKMTINYNQPLRMKLSLLAGGAFETQGLEGGVMIPAAFIDAHFRPSRFFLAHAAYSQQFQFGWQKQKIQDTRNIELGGRIFLGHRTVDKIKTFTAGQKDWNYDFNFPVKVLWNYGFSGSFKYGNAIFNSGTDRNTSIRFRNTETQQTTFIEQAAVPYTFSEISAGFVVNTNTAMKITAHLPYGKNAARRMKTFTEFRVEAVYGTSFRASDSISIKPSETAYHNENYQVLINRTSNWGFKMQGIFRRRWIGFKVEAGVRPGVYYRFSESQRDGVLDRSYLLFGLGIGWM